MKRILVAAALIALNGCSGGMDKAECSVADWRAIGYEDGAKGYRADSFGKRRKACAEHGIAGDFNGYRAGHAEGLTVYCRPQNGYNIGVRGYRNSGICPRHLAGAFAAAHTDGFGLYERQRAVRNLGKRLNSSRGRVKSIEDSLNKKTIRLASPGVPLTRRAQIALDIRKLAEEKVEVQQSITELEYEYAQARQEYEGYRAALSNR